MNKGDIKKDKPPEPKKPPATIKHYRFLDRSLLMQAEKKIDDKPELSVIRQIKQEKNMKEREKEREQEEIVSNSP